MANKVSLAEKFEAFSDHWVPRIVARYNDNEVRLLKVEGEFAWHQHADTDELFLVMDGTLDVELRDPRGTEHRPCARQGEVKVLLIDPVNLTNTGGAATATEAVEI